MAGNTCGDILNVIKNASYVLAPVSNPMVDLKVRVDKKDLEKELLAMCQGNLKQPSGFYAQKRKLSERRRYGVVLRYADLAQ